MSTDNRKPSPASWIAAALGMTYFVLGVFVVFGDLALTTFGLDTISRRLLLLGLARPWTAGAIAFVFMLPIAGLGGHLWMNERTMDPWHCSLAGALLALVAGGWIGYYFFGQTP